MTKAKSAEEKLADKAAKAAKADEVAGSGSAEGAPRKTDGVEVPVKEPKEVKEKKVSPKDAARFEEKKAKDGRIS